MRFFDLPVLPAKGIERFLTGLLVYFFIQEHAVLVFFLPCLTLCLLAAWGMSAAARNVWVSTIFLDSVLACELLEGCFILAISWHFLTAQFLNYFCVFLAAICFLGVTDPEIDLWAVV